MLENKGNLPDLKLNYGKLYDEKGVGLIPAIILDDETNRLLMVGFMNPEAYSISRSTGLATFWSRDQRKLWTKGETSGNYLKIQRWIPDCDNDTIAVWVKPIGPVCHRGTESCFDPVSLR